MLLLIFGAVGASMMTGCSEGSFGGSKTTTSTFMLTATLGGVVHTQMITLNVNNLGQ